VPKLSKRGCGFLKLSKTLFPAILIELVTEAEIQQSQTAPTASTPKPESAIEPYWKKPLPLPAALLWSAVAVGAFHVAYSTPSLAIFTVVYLFALLQLMRARSARQSFYLSLVVGMFIAAPQLSCFWVLFGPSAIVLWLILAFWTALFVTLGRLCLNNLGVRGGLFLPFLWTGLEYFRSELYHLKFSWLNIGYAFSHSSYAILLKHAGVYGIGFGAVAVATAVCLLGLKRAALWIAGSTLVIAAISVLWFFVLAPYEKLKGPKTVHVAGVQLEFPAEFEVISALDKLIESKPDTQVIVLCEYAFLSPIPDKVKLWCKDHQRFLVAGGKDPLPSGDFYDTAFVVGTNGDIVFKQGKSVPVQFLKDGLPAKEQKLWESPWGKIGICICYDLSYTLVTDRLVRMGAQGLIVPTMDVVEWGKHEHELHARVARVRAAEYGIPIFRIASSGISQLVDRSGFERASAGFPGQKEMVSGTLGLWRYSSLPIDRWLGPASVGVSGLIILFLVARRVLRL
jgi:apolipoprotein N-acyltransferase